MKGILFLLGKTERRGKEAVQRRSCKSAGTEDCKDLTILFVPLFENVAKEQSEENGKAVEGVAHQNTSIAPPPDGTAMSASAGITVAQNTILAASEIWRSAIPLPIRRSTEHGPMLSFW